MVNYKNSKIFKIVNNKNNKLFYGITSRKYISKLFASIINNYKNNINNKKYINLYNEFTKIGVENFKIEFIEFIECNDKEELNKKFFLFLKDKESLNN